ncbi:hypothetical protein [Secundilactobacillus kimchicus]|uniref:Phage protein n=1 Tax=Secundilactobacillus kimchicus JCM 15530 TaxID=1302272 RepID=A0A0R1HQA6_9LACO|nr:hypothetical protein FC96_GL001366 [Secundilactobacillus kimchicus JCM 15530]MBT9671760.1 hypothetical protein [Secundilactobacillus kimchicus]
MGLEDAFRSMPLSKLWFDKATIYGVIPGVDADGFTNGKDTVIIENEPCKVVLKGLKASEQSFFGTDNYDAKLLIRVGIDIPAGAKITIRDANGRTTNYKRASKGYSGYLSHQEVAMVRDEKAKEVVK